MKIEKCPLCGAKAAILTDEDIFNAVVTKHGTGIVQVGCTNHFECGVSLYAACNHADYDRMCSEGVERWNRRVTDG